VKCVDAIGKLPGGRRSRNEVRLIDSMDSHAITVSDFSPEEFLERLLAQPTG